MPAKPPSNSRAAQLGPLLRRAECMVDVGRRPVVSAAYMLKLVHDPHMNSSTSIASVNGPAWPPCFSSTASVRQPASNSAFHASLKPAGTWTWPPTSVQPVASPVVFSGPRYFWTQPYASSRTVMTSSLPQFANGALPSSSSRWNCSNRRKLRSRTLAL